MGRFRFIKLIALTLVLCVLLPLAACDEGDLPEQTQPGGAVAPAPQGTESSSSSAPPPGETAQADGGAPPMGGGLPTITIGDSEEGVMSGGEEFGFGFVEMSGEGDFDPDKQVIVSRSARPIRRIVKQDVYGRELPDSFYFYRNLLGENEQRLYDQVYANAVELDPYFELSMRVHHTWMDSIIVAVRLDNPDLFWLDTTYSYTYDGSGSLTSVTLSFNDSANNIDAFKRQFYSCADSLLEYVMTFSNDIDKVKYCHDFLTHINSYAWAYLNQSAYSALCVGQTVCAGYASAFTYLMQRLGIPCVSLYGFAGEDHLWNMVYLDGSWYEMDVTWNDPVGNPPNVYYYDYFNITTGQMVNRQRYAPSSGLPSASGTYYSYSNYYGYSPGSDFGRINYGNPTSSLPPVYPGSAQYTTPSQPADDYDDYDDYDSGDFTDIFSGGGEEWSYNDVEMWLIGLSDAEWYALWDFFAEFLDEDEMEWLDEIDWDEFVEVMYHIMN